MSKIPCPLCRSHLDIKSSKKEKPYVTCDDCGMQMFVRLPSGIERLRTLAETKVSFLGKYVECTDCHVAVKKLKQKIRRPLFGRPGLYCPECDAFLLAAPKDA